MIASKSKGINMIASKPKGHKHDSHNMPFANYRLDSKIIHF